jgi:hypothetical protein
MDPTWSNVLYYVENIALACGLAFVSVLFALGKSRGMKNLAHWEPETEPGRFYRLRRLFRWVRVNQGRIGGFLIFFFGAVSYTVVGVHAAMGIPLLQNGVWPWYQQVVRLIQVVGIWLFIRGITARRDYDNDSKKELQPPK